MNNFLRIKIDGLNLDKIINSLVDNGILIKNLKSKNKCVMFEISARDEKILKETCKKFHKNYKIIFANNIKNFVYRLKNYFGFLLALILISCYIFSFNLYVFEVNVTYSSNFGFDLTNVKNVLRENNIQAGAKRQDINIREIQNLILQSQDNVAGCTVEKKGGKINIVIFPGIKKEDINKNNVFSKYNAIVTKVNIFAGKTNIKVGDLVKINDVLIENDNGAKGEILGKVYYSDYIIFNENQFEKQFTGKIFESESISIFDKIVIKSRNFCNFLNYEEKNCVFCVSKNMFFKIEYIKTKYLEFEYKDIIVPFESVETELKQQLYNSIIKKIEQIDKITNVTYSIVRENNLVRLDCFVECEINLTE